LKWLFEQLSRMQQPPHSLVESFVIDELNNRDAICHPSTIQPMVATMYRQALRKLTAFMMHWNRLDGVTRRTEK
jgi:hypothetical protein